ncbi:transcriptional regulator [Lactobacillus selangorensis]|uniref:Transcriptional regulator n=1 Tax=Lactobacillus selangorensis TaxID=81857 RepID=A0A0R2FLW0_9LACO|nr:ATP-binding protein [Lactobacillus selangorensis]KRN28699.1 transcriptional regulator [Lactobacillus selangorensis]KRN32890.1 transcriptional regulator [Lactobacillus selangorensis]
MYDNEDSGIEYKATLNNHLKREIDSFLNSQTGGVIYLGVDDKTRAPQSVGQETRHQWEEIITNWAMNAFYPIPYSLIEVLPNADVFTIKIKSGRHKLYAIAKNGFDSSGVYVREGSSAVRASNERVQRMLQEFKMSGEFDSETSDNQNLTFRVAKSVFDGLDINFDQNSLSLMKNGKYNNAALLISDENPYSAKLAMYDGLNVMSFKDKREFVGAITKQIDEVLDYLDLANHKQVIISGNAQRAERKDYPSVAIREAIVNAFVHRDYLLHSNVKVELFDDRLEIVSPGGIPDGLSLEEIKDGMTAARNPRLIHILDKMNYIENYGTGIRRIFAAYDDTSEKPGFEVRENSFKIILPNKNYTNEIHPEDDHKFNFVFTKNEQKILAVLKNADGPLKRTEIEGQTGLTKNKAFSALRSLQKKSVIKVVGASVSTRYEII